MNSTLQQDRCTQDDYVRLFADSGESFRWLCYTLTADEELSEKVLSASLEQSLKGADRVFRDWMMSWARRLIIKVCAEIVRPRTSAIANEPHPLLPMRTDAVNRSRVDVALTMPAEDLQQRLMGLDSLQRFVFVLRAIEGYSRHETALLLDIDDRLCEWTYVKAAQAIEADWTSAGLFCGASPMYQGELCLAQAGD